MNEREAREAGYRPLAEMDSIGAYLIRNSYPIPVCFDPARYWRRTGEDGFESVKVTV